MINKNQLVGVRGGKNPFYFPDPDVCKKYNYSNGAGWRTKKNIKSRLGWGIRRKIPGGRAIYIGA
jgi:hypothetical protein